MDSSEEERKGE